MLRYAKLASAVLLPAVIVLAGCGGAKPAEVTTQATPVATAPSTPAPAQTQQTPAAPASQVQEINIKLGDHFIEPKLITVSVGTKVKLTITNSGEKKHDFSIDSYKIDSDLLSPGGTQTIEFVADKAGQFKIICTQRGHADKGMEAVLEVK